MTSSRILIVAAILGALAVAAGAFGSHGLREVLTASDLEIWETAVRYHAWHSIALLGCAALAPARRLALPVWCFTIGAVIFAGSLYVLVLTDMRWLGAVTPVGGTLLIAGWVALAFVRRA